MTDYEKYHQFRFKKYYRFHNKTEHILAHKMGFNFYQISRFQIPEKIAKMEPWRSRCVFSNIVVINIEK